MDVPQHDSVRQVPPDFLPLSGDWPARRCGQFTFAKARHFLTGAAPPETAIVFDRTKSVIEFTFASEIWSDVAWYGACSYPIDFGWGIRT